MDTCELETIQFKDLPEMIAWLRENTAMDVVSKVEVAAARRETTFFLNTEDGKKALRANHFFYVKEIRRRISQAFNLNFKCDGCKYEETDGDRCASCNVVQNIINAM